MIQYLIISDVPDQVGISENTFPETLSVFSEVHNFPPLCFTSQKQEPIARNYTLLKTDNVPGKKKSVNILIYFCAERKFVSLLFCKREQIRRLKDQMKDTLTIESEKKIKRRSEYFVPGLGINCAIMSIWRLTPAPPAARNVSGWQKNRKPQLLTSEFF